MYRAIDFDVAFALHFPLTLNRALRQLTDFAPFGRVPVKHRRHDSWNRSYQHVSKADHFFIPTFISSQFHHHHVSLYSHSLSDHTTHYDQPTPHPRAANSRNCLKPVSTHHCYRHTRTRIEHHQFPSSYPCTSMRRQL